jgi:type I restriction enzyme S subunit
MNGRPALDLGDAEWGIVREILRRHVPDRTVWAFGSRVKGAARPFSDLDLAVLGDQPLSLDTCAVLAEAFADSDLPWRVDVVDWASTSGSFRHLIEQDKVVVQEAQEASRPGSASPVAQT